MNIHVVTTPKQVQVGLSLLFGLQVEAKNLKKYLTSVLDSKVVIAPYEVEFINRELKSIEKTLTDIQSALLEYALTMPVQLNRIQAVDKV